MMTRLPTSGASPADRRGQLIETVTTTKASPIAHQGAGQGEGCVKNADDGQSPTRLFRGARVRMSRLGRERHPKYGDRQGVIVGRGSPSSWRVKFDERTTIQAIHRDYLELVAQPAATSRQVAQRRSSQGGASKP